MNLLVKLGRVRKVAPCGYICGMGTQKMEGVVTAKQLPNHGESVELDRERILVVIKTACIRTLLGRRLKNSRPSKKPL
jgi:hypothetical protein